MTMVEVEPRKPLGMAIYDILREAQANDKREGRCTVRYSFFRPVVIHIGDRTFSGFSREVSELGIGLLHKIELPPGDIELRIASEQGYSVRIRTRILWCSPCGEAWYISGGEFVGIAGIGR